MMVKNIVFDKRKKEKTLIRWSLWAQQATPAGSHPQPRHLKIHGSKIMVGSNYNPYWTIYHWDKDLHQWLLGIAPLHNGLIAQFDDSVSKIHPYLIRSHSLWLRIRPSKNILYWIFFRGEYFSGVNIVQGWIFFRGEYFSGVNIFQEWIFFRGEYFEYGVIMNDSVSDTESYFRYGVII